MAHLDLAAASNVMKDQYLPRLRMQLNDKPGPIYAALEASSHQVVGEKVVGSAHTQRNPSVASIAEYGDLPTIGRQGYEKFETDLAYHYGRMGVTGQVIRRARSDPGAFVNATVHESDRLSIDAKQMMQRQVFNDKDGFIMKPSGNHTSNVIPVVGATRNQYLSLVVGMELDIGTAASSKVRGDGVVLASWDRTAETITVVGTLTGTILSSDFIRIKNSYDDSAQRTYESIGIGEIIGSGDSLHSINGATVPPWNSYISTAGSLRDPTELLFETALDEVQIESGMSPTLAVGPHGVVRKYADGLAGQKRYVDNVELKGGYSALPISSGDITVGLISDRWTPGNQVNLISPEYLTWNQAADWEWMDEDGSVFSRIQNKDAYEATMFSYQTLTTSQRNAHARIEMLNEA